MEQGLKSGSSPPNPTTSIYSTLSYTLSCTPMLGLYVVSVLRTLRSMCGYSPHFTGEETEVQRGEATCSESHSALWEEEEDAYNNELVFIELFYVQSSLNCITMATRGQPPCALSIDPTAAHPGILESLFQIQKWMFREMALWPVSHSK